MPINLDSSDSLSPQELTQFEGGLHILAKIIARVYIREQRALKGDLVLGNAELPLPSSINLPTEKLTLSVSEVSKLLGMSRNAVYEAIRQGQIPSIRLGKRILVPRLRLEMLLSQSVISR
jgi:excisionase family DNA binding protein